MFPMKSTLEVCPSLDPHLRLCNGRRGVATRRDAGNETSLAGRYDQASHLIRAGPDPAWSSQPLPSHAAPIRGEVRCHCSRSLETKDTRHAHVSLAVCLNLFFLRGCFIGTIRASVRAALRHFIVIGTSRGSHVTRDATISSILLCDKNFKNC